MNFLTADVAVVVDASKLPAQLAKIKATTTRTVKKIQTSFKKMSVSFKKAFDKMVRVAKFAAVGIVAALTVVARAAMKQEDAIFLLNAALKISGEFTDELAEKFQNFAAEIQQTTIYGDEFVLGLLQQQKSLGVTADKLEEAAKMAIGLATATGRGIESMSMYVALAMQGEFTMLQRYIPALRTTKDETEKLAIVTKFAADGFKLAQERALTASGKLKQLWNTLGDIAEILGAPLLKPLAEWSDKLKENREQMEVWAEDIADRLKNIIEWFVKWRVAILKAVAALGGLLIMSKITGVVIALTAAVKLLAGAFVALGTSIAYYNSVLLGFVALSGSWKVGILSFLGLMQMKFHLNFLAVTALVAVTAKLVLMYRDWRKAAVAVVGIEERLAGVLERAAKRRKEFAESAKVDAVLRRLQPVPSGPANLRDPFKTVEDSQQSLGENLQIWIDRSLEWGRNLGDTLTTTFENASDALTDFVMTGKADFAALADSFVRDMSRMIIQAEMAQALGMFIPGLSGGSGAYGGRGLLGGLFPVGEKVASAQSGGVVEKTGLAKIHKGETFSGVGKNNGGNTVNINVSTFDPAGTYNFLNENKRTIATMLEGTIKSNHSLRRSTRSGSSK